MPQIRHNVTECYDVFEQHRTGLTHHSHAVPICMAVSGVVGLVLSLAIMFFRVRPYARYTPAFSMTLLQIVLSVFNITLASLYLYRYDTTDTLFVVRFYISSYNLMVMLILIVVGFSNFQIARRYLEAALVLHNTTERYLKLVNYTMNAVALVVIGF